MTATPYLGDLDYHYALKRITELMRRAVLSEDEREQLDDLLDKVEEYEEFHYPIND